MLERRTSSRFKLNEPAAATLRVDDRDMPVVVVDVSASGYQISIPGDHTFPVGKWLLLFANGVWTEVCVVRIEQRPGETCLGLRRDRELANEEDFQEFKPTLTTYFPRIASTKVAAGIGAAGLGGLLVLGLSLWLIQDFVLSLKSRSRSESEEIRATVSVDASPVIFQPRSPSDGESDFGERVVARSAFIESARLIFGLQSTGSEAETVVLGSLESVAALCDPEVLSELQLTRNQMESIQQIVDAGKNELSSQLAQTAVDEQAVQQVQQLREQVRSVLNRTQLRRLDSLIEAARR